jgi:hypothetical protein
MDEECYYQSPTLYGFRTIGCLISESWCPETALECTEWAALMGVCTWNLRYWWRLWELVFFFMDSIIGGIMGFVSLLTLMPNPWNYRIFGEKMSQEECKRLGESQWYREGVRLMVVVALILGDMVEQIWRKRLANKEKKV